MNRHSVAVVSLIIACSISAAPPDFVTKARTNAAGSNSAAKESLKRLRALTGQESNQRFNFMLATPAAAPTLGTPLPVYMARLEELRSYDPSKQPDPQKILRDTNRILYLVVAETTVVSAVEVIKQDNEWVTSRMGGVQSAQRIDETAKALHLGFEHAMLVEIPGLRLTFMAFMSGQVLMLAPVSDAPQFSLHKGVAEPAGAIFFRVAPAAKTRYTSAPS